MSHRLTDAISPPLIPGRRALSVRAPWWWFILHGGKDIENRTRPTNFRGTVYAHTSQWYVHKTVVDDLWLMRRSIPGLVELLPDGIHPYSFLRPYGGSIVGMVDIVDCVQTSSSPWFFGPYGYVLQNPVAFNNPIRCKGMLGFFTPKLEAEEPGERVGQGE